MNLQEEMDYLGIETEIEIDNDLTGEREASFPGGTHYMVTFTRPINNHNAQPGYPGALHTPFSTGSAWTREPEPVEVMRDLLRDATSLQWVGSFEGWANDMGYDTDSRKAEKIYNAIERATDDLHTFLQGTIVYDLEVQMEVIEPGDNLERWLEDPEVMDESLDDTAPSH